MKKLLYILFACLMLSSCKQTEKKPVETSQKTSQKTSEKLKEEKRETSFLDTFDTIIKFISYENDEATFKKQADYVTNEFKRLHKLYDNYNEYEGIANVMTLNKNAGKGPVKVEKDLLNLIQFSKDSYEKYTKNTNIAMGKVLEIWHQYREEGIDNPDQAKLPDMEKLKEAMKDVNIDDIVIDKEASTVELKSDKISLDLGAVAKGYATELVCDGLVEMGADSFIISAGGNVKSIGYPHDGTRDYWGIGIQNPENAFGKSDQGTIDVLYLNNKSVVTSGTYQRFYQVDGKKYHHLIDPKTLMPSDYFTSVSIITEDSGLADFLSTAAFLMPLEESKKFVESLDGVEAIWILNDNSVVFTDGIKDRLKGQGAKNVD